MRLVECTDNTAFFSNAATWGPIPVKEVRAFSITHAGNALTAGGRKLLFEEISCLTYETELGFKPGCADEEYKVKLLKGCRGVW